VFLDNPLFTWFAAPSLREQNLLVLPFGESRTSPIATSDVARTVAAVLEDPAHRIGEIYELTGPRQASTSMDWPSNTRWIGAADSRHRHSTRNLGPRGRQALGLPEHVEQHLITMALLHRAGRYDRATDDVERVTGQSASTVGHYVAERPELFS